MVGSNYTGSVCSINSVPLMKADLRLRQYLRAHDLENDLSFKFTNDQTRILLNVENGL